MGNKALLGCACAWLRNGGLARELGIGGLGSGFNVKVVTMWRLGWFGQRRSDGERSISVAERENAQGRTSEHGWRKVCLGIQFGGSYSGCSINVVLVVHTCMYRVLSFQGSSTSMEGRLRYPFSRQRMVPCLQLLLISIRTNILIPQNETDDASAATPIIRGRRDWWQLPQGPGWSRSSHVVLRQGCHTGARRAKSDLMCPDHDLRKSTGLW